ncbi:MAG: MarR family EPS-associated transcriptional regulator [Chitinivibrionales bacterium]|nr:MarR family EPS-associated transcriptional regulator [Chitinivibrionales bacterium]
MPNNDPTIPPDSDPIQYQVLRELEHNPAQTQRTLAGKLDISLGKANYVLAGLIDKGIVKARKARRNPGKVRWQYVLTPTGIREKMRITREYLRRRVHEYEAMGQEIEALRREVGEPAADRRGGGG